MSSKLSSLVDVFEKALAEASSKRQVVNDLSSQLNTARTQLDSAELAVRSAKSELSEEVAKNTANLSDQTPTVKFA